MSGKSTVARGLSRWLGWDLLHTDDFGAVARSVTLPRQSPDLHPMSGYDWRAYYTVRRQRELMADAIKAHMALWPAIESIVRARADWADPAVLEGWALLPELVKRSNFTERVGAVWIVPSDEVFEPRVRAARSFYDGAEKPELLIRKFCQRSKQFNLRLAKRAEAHGFAIVAPRQSDSIAVVRDKILHALEGDRGVKRRRR
jgi:2-phosphoglycerate kinase